MRVNTIRTNGDTEPSQAQRELLVSSIEAQEHSDRLLKELATLEAFAEKKWGTAVASDRKTRWQTKLLFAESSKPHVGLQPLLPESEQMLFGMERELLEQTHHLLKIVRVANGGWYTLHEEDDGSITFSILTFNNGDERDIWSVSKASFDKATGNLYVEPEQVLWD